MNERIKELALQARAQAEDAYKKQNEQFTSHWDNPIGYTVSQFFEQKFAELIVKECAELMKKESEDYSNIGSEYCDHKAEAFDEAVDLVKKHFGID